MDALVRELNRLGYQPVFLPRTNIEPPEIYTFAPKLKRLVRRGALKQYLPEAAGLTPTTGQLANINYSYTSTKRGQAAVSFLENALKCIGIDSAPKLNLDFSGSKDFSFAFTGVTYRKVDPAEIERILAGLSTGGIPDDLVAAGRMHIAYDYAYANELVMSRGDKREFSQDISAKVSEFLDLGVKGSVSVASKSTLSFKGATGARAAFAYMAGYLSRENGGPWEFHPEEVRRARAIAQPYVPQRGVVLFAK